MSVEVDIKLKTRIVHANGEEEILSNQLRGTLYEKGDEFFLRYQEYMGQDLGITWTTIRWNRKTESNVTILRQGDIKMKQVFDKNKVNLAQYHSPYGILDMKTITHELVIANCIPTSGRIELHYQLSINHQGVSEYWLEVEYSNGNTEA